MSEFLRAEAFDVRLAGSGAKGLAQMQAACPSVVLTDIQMAGIDGLEVIRRIRAEPAWGNVPIVAVTALAMPGDQDRCLEAGANAYLPKPVNLRKLAQTLQEVLRDNPHTA